MHIMCLEVATGESGTIDGPWVRVCEFFYLKKNFFFSMEHLLFHIIGI